MLIVKTIELEGFRSFLRNTVITFPESGAILIRGQYKGRAVSSGSGKSSILIAISYALGFSSVPATELKNWDAKAMKVALTLKDTATGTEWKIIRDPKLSIETPNGLVVAGADETLAQILRTSPELASALTYREQREPGNFINRTDSGKKEFLTTLLRLGEIEKAVDDFSTEFNILAAKKAQAEGSLIATENALQINPVTDEQVAMAVQAFSEAQARVQSLANPESQITTLRQEESQIRAEMQKIRMLTTSAAGATASNQRIRQQILGIQAEVNQLKTNLCPTCQRPWDNCGPQIEQREAQIKTLIDQMQQNLTTVSTAGTYATAEQSLSQRLSYISQMVGQLMAPAGDSQRAGCCRKAL
jgi:DNA repair exonuclease SbcCD ATPase subunit